VSCDNGGFGAIVEAPGRLFFNCGHANLQNAERVALNECNKLPAQCRVVARIPLDSENVGGRLGGREFGPAARPNQPASPVGANVSADSLTPWLLAIGDSWRKYSPPGGVYEIEIPPGYGLRDGPAGIFAWSARGMLQITEDRRIAIRDPVARAESFRRAWLGLGHTWISFVTRVEGGVMEISGVRRDGRDGALTRVKSLMRSDVSVTATASSPKEALDTIDPGLARAVESIRLR
jgi:hypothetical protein